MGFQLVIIKGRSSAPAHRLGTGVTLIGRQDGCQLQIKSSQVSRKHCEISEENGQLVVKDLKSSNGTFVNGQKITAPQPLKPGDELMIGGVKFRIEQADVKPGDKAKDTIVSEGASKADSSDAIPVEDATVLVSERPAKPAADAAEEEPVLAEAATPELGEDAVADFLMNLDLDEDDK